MKMKPRAKARRAITTVMFQRRVKRLSMSMTGDIKRCGGI